VFDKFPEYHMKILLGDFNAKVGRKDIFTPTIRNESLYEIIMIIRVSSLSVVLSSIELVS
jgi:hypothetical protein